MIWVVGGGLCLIGACYRILRGRGRWRHIWWWSFTLTLLGMTAGGAVLADQPGVNATLGTPNIAFLLSEIGYAVAAGAVMIYCHTLRHLRISWPAVWGHALTAAAVGTACVLGWLGAPLHQHSYADVDQIPLFWPWALTYEVGFNVYYLIVLWVVTLTAAAQRRSTPRYDVGRKIGTTLITCGGAVGVIASGCYLVRDITQPILGASRALAWNHAGDTLIGIGTTCGIALGTVILLAGPEIHARLQTRRAVAGLTPLWRRLVDLYPQVQLVDQPAQRIGRRSGFVAERLVIEITDGLNLLPIETATSTRHTPDDRTARIESVVDSLVDPGSGDDSTRLYAARVLGLADPAGDPTDRSHRPTERQLLLDLASAYHRRIADGMSLAGQSEHAS